MKKIIFFPDSKETELMVSPPKPASSYIPEWFKKTDAFVYSKKPEYVNGEIINKSIKLCVPFKDSLSMGYIQETWCDIYISKTEEGLQYHSSSNLKIIGHRNHVSSKNFPGYFYDTEFTWSLRWMPKLPKGYSCFFTHPFNRNDLPFRTLTGIVDSDSYYSPVPGSYPFYIKNDFEGMIPKGTPMFQIIPFKRDDWESSVSPFSEKIWNKQMSTLRGTFLGAYKKFMHTPKKFK